MIVASPCCGCRPESGSGGERYESRILAGLVRVGVDPHVQLVQGKRYPLDLFGHVESFWSPLPLRWWAMPFLMAQRIGACWRDHEFDVLRVHSATFLGPAALIARRRYGITAPVVVQVHHWEPAPGLRWLERRVLRQADRVIVDSQFVRQQVLAQGVPADRIRVVYCGADQPVPATLPPASVRATYGVPISAPLILSLGPCIPRKDPLGLLRIFRMTAQYAPDAHLVWCGDGPLRRRALTWAEGMGLADRVHFPGFVPESDKRALLATATVFAFTSRLEGCPLAVLEAMAAGLPVVAWRAASLPELLGDGAGCLATTATEFSTDLAILIQQRRTREGLNRRAMEVVAERFTWARAVEGVRAALTFT